MNMMHNANGPSREGLPLKIKEWADMINQGKKLCILWGKDKPRIVHVNNKFAFRFIDIIDECATVKSMAGNQPYTDEFFYWTPDKPELLIKQAHLIKNYLNQPNLESLPFVSLTKSDLAYKEINGKKYWLNNHGVHSIIYPNWDISTYSSGKIASVIFSDRDHWFFNSNNLRNIEKKCSARIIEAKFSSSLAEWLTRETSGQNIEIWNISFLNFGDIPNKVV